MVFDSFESRTEFHWFGHVPIPLLLLSMIVPVLFNNTNIIILPILDVSYLPRTNGIAQKEDKYFVLSMRLKDF